MAYFACTVLISMTVCFSASAEPCKSFTASTMNMSGITSAKWRTDYPSVYPDPRDDQVWESINFRVQPIEYMDSVLEDVRTSFREEDRQLIGTGHEAWWISEWLDYGSSGREPLMGLTKERGPDEGDLSPTNKDGYQVWAVGFYNRAGAAVLGEVFADPCNPSLPVAIKFPADTVAIKFLFTDASPDEVTYLQGGPEFDAYIDPAGSGGTSLPHEDRVIRGLRLLQLDIAVRDTRSIETGWVFGTFVWRGPAIGDRLFDNLVPVSLQWGNDPTVFDSSVRESWTNSALHGVTHGWERRPTLGFLGRANGPADNIRSSCLSCHAAARTPRASIGILGSRFDMADVDDPAAVRRHVETWFQNIKAGALFEPADPSVSSLDYSLQLEAAVFRMCIACRAGDLTGETPSVCRSSGFYNRSSCSAPAIDAREGRDLEMMTPPRQ